MGEPSQSPRLIPKVPLGALFSVALIDCVNVRNLEADPRAHTITSVHLLFFSSHTFAGLHFEARVPLLGDLRRWSAGQRSHLPLLHVSLCSITRKKRS